jgi:hypothetical protein
MSDLRERVDQAVETLTAALDGTSTRATRYNAAELILKKFLPMEDDK